jgi:DNA modification methylase
MSNVWRFYLQEVPAVSPLYETGQDRGARDDAGIRKLWRIVNAAVELVVSRLLCIMETLFDLPTPNPKHPAKYTDALMSAFIRMSHGCSKILDPFGGTGKVFLLNRWHQNAEIHAVEIEPEWAKIHPKTTLGNALELLWQDNYFDCICTSPTYGNHMADQSTGITEKAGKTFKYRAMLGRKLHPSNSGQLHWNNGYQEFHIKAWQEASRVLCPSGKFILNIKNHIRDGVEQLVTEWHIEMLLSLGYEMIEHKKINTPSMRFGRNGEKRIEYESVILFVLKSKRLLTPREPDKGEGSPLPELSNPEADTAKGALS